MKSTCLTAIVCLIVAGSACGYDLSIVDCGAIDGGCRPCTDAIQRTIDTVSACGGGTVRVPPGVFCTGAIFLKPGVTLHLDEGAVLLGSTDLADYPRRVTRIEGHFEPWPAALINAHDLQGVTISGSGTIDGNGRPFWVAFWKRRAEKPDCTNLEVERPRLLFFDSCSDVTVEGIHLKDSGFWNLHLYNCQGVLVDGVSIRAPHGDPPTIVDPEQPWNEISVNRAPSSDGIDVDSSRDVTIRRCTISNGDDCIALKGTKGPMAMDDEASPPVENILIEDCTFLNGHGMVTCGSEATVVRNVVVRNCRIAASVPIVRLKLRPDTPQLYENLLFEDIEAEGAQALFDVKPWTQFFDLQGHDPPRSIVRNVVVRNVRGSFRSLGELRGNPGDVLEEIVLEEINVTTNSAFLQTDSAVEILGRRVLVNGVPFSLR